jgi:hypothetical protein
MERAWTIIMKQLAISIKNENEARIFIQEFLTLSQEGKTHIAIIRNIDTLQKRIRKHIKSNQKPSDKISIVPIAHDKDLQIILKFIPQNIKLAFKTHPPYILCINPQIFDKIKGTNGKVSAFAFPFTNCIIMSAEHDKKSVHSLLIHEFLHYASELGSSWSNWRDGVNEYKPWVVEGITELYTERLMAANHLVYKQHKTYEKYVAAVRQIEAVLGKENLKEIYFKGDIKAILLSKNERLSKSCE